MQLTNFQSPKNVAMKNLFGKKTGRLAKLALTKEQSQKIKGGNVITEEIIEV